MKKSTAIALVWLVTVLGAAAEIKARHAIGLRSGISASDYGHRFVQTELSMLWKTPWQWSFGTNCTLTPKLETTAGDLVAHGDHGFVGTAGPVLRLEWGTFPLVVECGLRPTVLSRYRFDGLDFGIPFQFTSHGGIGWKFRRRWEVGYRFQHMSNAGLGANNPGLNLHLVGLHYELGPR